MTKQIIFIQGGGAAGVHDAWDDKLVASLSDELGSGYKIHYPRMPNEAEPNYTAWKTAIQDGIAKLRDCSILVGHSIGATILINAIANDPPRKKLVAIFLIAPPFIGPGGWSSDEFVPSSDIGARLPPKAIVYLYQGSEDATTPIDHVDLYKQAIPQAHVRKLKGRDHQLNNDLSEVAADILTLE